MKFSPKMIAFRCLSILLSVMALGGFLEIALRFLPVNEGLSSMPVNEEAPILHFTPQRTSLWSRTWNFSHWNIVKTNNYGFISNIDYIAHDNTPLIAIIGDSYVEAAMIPWEQTVAGRLQQRLSPDWRVYAFGASGAALGQYVAYANYVVREFHPDIVVFIIVGNDFDESLLKYKRVPGFHYFAERNDHELVLQRIDYEPEVWRRFLRKSALVMYLATNLNLSRVYFNLKYRFSGQKFVANTQAQVDEARLMDSQKAVDAFFSMILAKTGLTPHNMICILDGIRPQLYDQEALRASTESYYGQMRRYVLKHAHQQGVTVIDMQPIFIAHYQQHGQRFEFPDDGHWNALGHKLTATAIADSGHFVNSSE